MFSKKNPEAAKKLLEALDEKLTNVGRDFRTFAPSAVLLAAHG